MTARGTDDHEAIVRDKEAEVDSAITVLRATDQIFEYIAVTEKILAKCSNSTIRESRRSSIRVKPELLSPRKPSTVSRDIDTGREIREHQRSASKVHRDEVRFEDTPNVKHGTTSAQAPKDPQHTAHPAPKKQKRSRPSFPPREGPDYTRPLPTASAIVKNQRLHPFKSSDLR